MVTVVTDGHRIEGRRGAVLAFFGKILAFFGNKWAILQLFTGVTDGHSGHRWSQMVTGGHSWSQNRRGLGAPVEASPKPRLQCASQQQFPTRFPRAVGISRRRSGAAARAGTCGKACEKVRRGSPNEAHGARAPRALALDGIGAEVQPEEGHVVLPYAAAAQLPRRPPPRRAGEGIHYSAID